MSETRRLLERLETWDWSAGVIGMGYVGLPLAVSLARAGVPVVGYDIDHDVVERLGEGRSHIDDVADDDLGEVRERARFSADVGDLREPDVLFICVPTPLAVGKRPDMRFIEAAVEAVASILRPGHLVILESTTYPGTTEDTVRPVLERAGATLDVDFLLAYSPERIDPGNRSFRTENIPRIVGGASEDSTRAAALVYSRIVEKVHVVSSARAAEMAKLLENTFRWINIALVNEMAEVAQTIGVDIWEVIDAAATKPFGFMPFYPGPGVGGHCIPLDPFYLQWAAQRSGEGARFIELAEAINERRPQLVVERARDLLRARGLDLQGARVVVLGVAYKPNISDSRESPALECIRLLLAQGAEVSFIDPHVAAIAVDGRRLESAPMDDERLARADLAVLLCDHDAFDLARVAERVSSILDTRNSFARRGIRSDHIAKL